MTVYVTVSKRAVSTTLKDRIISLISGGGKVEYETNAEVLEVDPDVVRTTLQDLKKRGTVDQSKSVGNIWFFRNEKPKK